MMGGKIWVESESGRGSSFHFTARLALADANAEAQPELQGAHSTAPAAPAAPAFKIMVVDDHAASREFLQRILVAWGMSPFVATSAEQALPELLNAAFDDVAYDVVVLDAQMPGMDGYQLVEALNRAELLSPPNILLLTSAYAGEDTQRCIKLGIAHRLPKPVFAGEVRQALLQIAGTIVEQATGNATDRAAEKARAGSGSIAQKPASRNLNILLVEDNTINQQLALIWLEEAGHTVTICDDGQQALDMLERTSFDLVLMDMQMPVMDGIEATSRIRARETTANTATGSRRHLPIIAMTANVMAADRERCIAAGMDGYVSKPVQPDKLFAAIDLVVSKGLVEAAAA
jgi:CheY-like chemotaxis protein